MREEHDTGAAYINSPMPKYARRLAARIKEGYESEEFQAFWQPAKSAILHGDKDRVDRWAETRIGRVPDFVIRHSYLHKKDLGQTTPRETWALVDARGEKLASESRGEPDDEGIAVFDNKSKKYPRLRRIKSKLSRQGVWRSEIARAIREAGAGNEYGYPLSLGAIEWPIERDDHRRGIRGTPGKGSSEVKAARARIVAAEARATKGDLSAKEHADAVRAWRRAEEELEHVKGLAFPASLDTGGADGVPMEVEEGARIGPGVWINPPPTRGGRRTPEWEERMLNRLFLAHYANADDNPAELSSGELEVFQLAVRLEPRDIANRLGRSGDQVRQEKARAIKKIRRHAGIKEAS